jgi:hypothetical protein
MYYEKYYQVSFVAYDMSEHRLIFFRLKMETVEVFSQKLQDDGAQHAHFLTEEALFVEQVDSERIV